ncbi:MAG: TlpA family protein disulfide reductase [Deltaproteobacteria bacterium]|nr:TlpA family protein disulfide reductase [Deltaproteobacteria bacterium]
MMIFAPPLYGVDRGILKALGIQELSGNKEAPDFSLLDSDGRKISLKDFKGKVVILHLWATWCKPCKEEFPLFEKIYQRFKDKDVAFLPIAIDTKATQEDINAFAKKLGASFPVYLAREGNITDRYWTWGVPVTYFIDKRGFIAGRAIGSRDWASDKVIDLINALLEEK